MEKHGSLVLVFNKAGQLALQLRSATDESYPSYWDFSAGGGTEPGEDNQKAAERELWEELGVRAPVEFVGEYIYDGEKSRDYMFVYRTEYEGPFNPDPVEVADVVFRSLAEIKTMIASGEKFRPDFLHVLNKSFLT